MSKKIIKCSHCGCSEFHFADYRQNYPVCDRCGKMLDKDVDFVKVEDDGKELKNDTALTKSDKKELIQLICDKQLHKFSKNPNYHTSKEYKKLEELKVKISKI
jgi:transcription initiation factor TFIIIB Brf1 subunit/transcription initiation factor TFIIB